MRVKYLVFARNEDVPLGGGHDFVEAFDDAFAALGEMVEHPTAHIAEFNGEVMVIVAEQDGKGLKLYPERMAHVLAAATGATSDG
jgi:hypothetical protein